MSHLHEGGNVRDWLRFEEDSAARLTREQVTVLMGEVLLSGTVLGKIAASTPTTGTADSGNTGAGTIGSITAGQKAKSGEYQIKCLTYVAAPLAATFEVTDPDGLRLPDATLAAYVSDAINFDIADASPAITVGDIWTITVAAGSGKVVQVRRGATTAVDGSQDAYGILFADVDATLADVEAVAIVKDSVVIEANLVWPTSSPAMSAAEIVVAMAQLKDKGIVARDEA